MDLEERNQREIKGYQGLNETHPVDENIHLPNGARMELIYAKDDVPKRNAFVMVFPGGGYEYLAYRETRQVALAYAKCGYDTAVVYYRVKLWEEVRKDGQGLDLAPMIDAGHAIDYIRHRAEFANEKLVLLGFSAGGHLAAMMSTRWKWQRLLTASNWQGSLRPDGTILCYALTSRFPDGYHNQALEALTGTKKIEDYGPFSPVEYIDDETPPAFIWHNADDKIVPVVDSVLYAQGLTQHGVKSELLIFPRGGHGTSLAIDAVEPYGSYHQADSHIARWHEKSVAFIRDFIEDKVEEEQNAEADAAADAAEASAEESK